MEGWERPKDLWVGVEYGWRAKKYLHLLKIRRGQGFKIGSQAEVRIENVELPPVRGKSRDTFAD
jgi:hypothetical protein